MLEATKLQEYLELFQADLISSKVHSTWEAAQWFKSNWNPEDANFPSMLARCLLKAGVLFSNGKPARKQIQDLAQTHPEQVRNLFHVLYDDRQDLPTRVRAFRAGALSMLQENGESPAACCQDEETISAYLYLRDPQQYYPFRQSEAEAVSDALHASLNLPGNDVPSCMPASFALYKEISAYIEKSAQLLQQMYSAEVGLPAVTAALCERIGHLWKCADERGRYAYDYSPHISAENWQSMLTSSRICSRDALVLLKGLFVSTDGASCSQLAQLCGRTPSFYLEQAVFLAQQIARETGRPQADNVPVQLRPLLLPFRICRAKPGEPGALWLELRGSLRVALGKMDLSGVTLYENPQPGPKPPVPEPQKRYWWLSDDPAAWNSSQIRFLKQIPANLPFQDMVQQRTLMCMKAAQPGDAVLCFETGKVQKITALAQVELNQDDMLSFACTDLLVHPIPLDALRSVPELLDTVETVCNLKVGMVELTQEAYEKVCSLVQPEDPEPQSHEPYSKADFLHEVYWTESQYDRIVRLLESRRNVILQGAPGVGKTFAAQRLAWSILGEKSPDKVAMVQFHETFSYEDFVAGYRPEGEGFVLRYGMFYNFCMKASAHPKERYFFLIDEINRGSLSRIFGELLMLLEKDYRGTSIILSGDGKPFCVPDNVYLIGMMNTADRSLAMLDYALRRRFSFVTINPAFSSDGFQAYQKSLCSSELDALLKVIQALNQRIAADRSLGPGFCIGHSYFCGCRSCTKEWLLDIVENDIIPTIQEYWFDDPETVAEWEEQLRGAIQ